jgi:transposase
MANSHHHQNVFYQQDDPARRQLVIIYKCKWDIEKVFHQLKSKMEERKSLASSPEAKRAHGQFEYLAHNLLLFAEREMNSLGLEDEVE